MVNDTLVSWMNIFYPMSRVPQGTIVNISILIKRGPLLVYTFSVQAEVTHGDTWEELLPSTVETSFPSDSTNTSETGGGGGGGTSTPSPGGGSTYGESPSGYYESDCWLTVSYVRATGEVIGSDITCSYSGMP